MLNNNNSLSDPLANQNSISSSFHTTHPNTKNSSQISINNLSKNEPTLPNNLTFQNSNLTNSNRQSFNSSIHNLNTSPSQVNRTQTNKIQIIDGNSSSVQAVHTACNNTSHNTSHHSASHRSPNTPITPSTPNYPGVISKKRSYPNINTCKNLTTPTSSTHGAASNYHQISSNHLEHDKRSSSSNGSSGVGLIKNSLDGSNNRLNSHQHSHIHSTHQNANKLNSKDYSPLSSNISNSCYNSSSNLVELYPNWIEDHFKRSLGQDWDKIRLRMPDSPWSRRNIEMLKVKSLTTSCDQLNKSEEVSAKKRHISEDHMRSDKVLVGSGKVLPRSGTTGTGTRTSYFSHHHFFYCQQDPLPSATKTAWNDPVH